MVSTALLLLAFGLRAVRLGYQSLWYDEGSSVYLARQGLAAIARGAAADIHPPLYYYLLHCWALGSGYGEFGIRMLSVALGTLLAAVTLILGRRLLGASPAFLGTLLVAVSPLLVDYSQEARMYMLLALLGLAASYAALCALALRGHSTRWWLAYAGLTAAGLYTHYTYLFALVAQDAIFALWWFAELTRGRAPRPIPPATQPATCLGQQDDEAGRPRRALTAAPCATRPGLAALLAQLAAALLFVPWLPAASRQLGGWPAISEALSPTQLAERVLPLLSGGLRPHVGTPPLGPWAEAAVAVCLALAVVGALARGRERSRGRLALLLLWLAPLATLYLLDLRKPLYNPKFLLVAVPPYLLLAGAGWARLRGRLLPLGLAAAVPLLGLAGVTLRHYYDDPAYQRDDYRRVAGLIQALGRPGDALVLNAPGQEQVLFYYYRGPLPWVGLPRQRPLDEADTAARLQTLARDYRRIWLVLYGENGSDPRHFVEGWLNQHAFQALNRWYGDLRLAFYVTPGEGAAPLAPLGAILGRGIHLDGYGLVPAAPRADEALQVRLRWRADTAPGQRYKVFVHLIDDDESIWGQKDSEPQAGLAPTATWQPARPVEDRYGLLLLPGTPPGRYRVELGMYDEATGRRLPAAGPGAAGDRVLLPPLTVAPAEAPLPLQAFEIHHPLTQPLGGVDLLGYNLSLLGRDAEQSWFASGETLALTLFWRAGAAPRPDLRAALTLGQAVNLAATPGGPAYPSSRWREGEIVRSQHKLTLSRGLSPGRYPLVVSVEGRRIEVAQVVVR